jgi:hypothetical protein
LDDSGAGGCTTFFLLFLGLFSIFYFIFKSNIGLKSKNNVLQNAMRYNKGEKRKKGLYETSYKKLKYQQEYRHVHQDEIQIYQQEYRHTHQDEMQKYQ